MSVDRRHAPEGTSIPLASEQPHDSEHQRGSWRTPEFDDYDTPMEVTGYVARR